MKLLLMISHSGAFSRRKAFDAIRRGAVMVNGKVEAEPSTEVDPVRDEVLCSGRLIASKRFEYVVLNKPQGYITTCEGQFGQKTVLDLLPADLQHLRPVGRLDKDTEGLLFLTNDGVMANKLMHPSFDVDKTYLVRVRWHLTPVTAARLEQGVMIGGLKTAPATVRILHSGDKESELEITIHEGRKRQVRLMMDTVGHPVVYLSRLRQGPVTLGALESSAWRRLSDAEIARLREIRPQPDTVSRPLVVRNLPRRPLQVERSGRAERPAFSGRKPQAERPVRGAHPVSSERRPYSVDSRTKAPSRPERKVPGREQRRTATALPRPAFSSRTQVVRNAATREWHSDSDVHGPSARSSVRPRSAGVPSGVRRPRSSGSRPAAPADRRRRP
jgi:23S rRNA pseudouridine2605 synthase